MSIERRQQTESGPIRWRARYRGPDGKERSKTFARRTDAEKWYAAQTVDMATGGWSDPAKGRVTVRVWSERWLAGSPHLKPKTIVGYQSLLDNHILPTVGAVPIARLDRTAVKAQVGLMVADGKGAGTVKNVLNVLSAVCRFAVEAGAITVNPCHGVRTPPPPRDEMRFATAEEVSRLADAIDDRWRVLVLFAAFTGLRAGEIGALRVGRMDLFRRRVHVVESVAEVHGKLVTGPTKTYANRSVALPLFLRDLLAEHIADRADDPDAFVFRSPSGGQLRHASWRRRYFDPAAREAGLDGLRFHDLRHTCAALLIAQGAHPRAIMERLGHSSVTVSIDRYGHLFPSLDEQLTEGLDETWAQNLAAYPRPKGALAVLTTAQNQ